MTFRRKASLTPLSRSVRPSRRTFLQAAAAATATAAAAPPPPAFLSGIYPHLSVAGIHQSENGIGAVVPWAGRLYFITYFAGMNVDGAQRLFELDDALNLVPRGEPFYGGSIASRMIHDATRQLLIGPYFIDEQRNIRQLRVRETMPMHLSAVAKHLTDPDKVYFIGLAQERSLVDVSGGEAFIPASKITVLPTLSTIQKARFGFASHHGKGLYSGQGRIVSASNGSWPVTSPSGCLMEWDGRDEWTVVRRAQMDEVTGPGGIHGAAKPDDPIWSIGWDPRSALLMVREAQSGWHTYRLPKGGYTHDAPSGWYAEWPRIRDVGLGGGRLLMNQNGLLYFFPNAFTSATAGGLRPIATFHKMLVDYAEWNGRIVVGCDDASYFDNPLTGRVHSNLMFIEKGALAQYGGRPSGSGGVWLREDVQANAPSDPYLASGFDHRAIHLAHEGSGEVAFTLQLDARGDGQWTDHRTVRVAANSYAHAVLPPAVKAEWLRFRTDRNAARATAFLTYTAEPRPLSPLLVAGLASAGAAAPLSQGLLRVTKGEDYPLEFAADLLDARGARSSSAFYRAVVTPDRQLALRKADDPGAESNLRTTGATKQEFGLDAASAWVDFRGVRYRLPKGPAVFDAPTASGWRRATREVVSERALLNVHGTLYELPRPDAGGLPRIRPITTHHLQLFDFTTWRGLLVLSGVAAGAPAGGHILKSDDGRAALWLGNVDDLFHFGAPRGRGGPWQDSAVRAGQPSDPYLLCGYARKTLSLRSSEKATIAVQVDVDASGHWYEYARFPVAAGQAFRHVFPTGYSAHWVRLVSDRDATASATFIYE